MHREPEFKTDLLRYPLFAQSLYYLLCGFWPLLHMGSFLTVTGPKTDLWLVRTVALLVVVIGASLLVAALGKRILPETVVLAIGSIIAFTVVDVVSVLFGVISWVYLLDAGAEMVFLICWCFAFRGTS